MTTLLATDNNEKAFQTLLENLFKEKQSGSAANKIKEKAWQHFLKLGLPGKKNEVFRYVPLRQLFGQNYSFAPSLTLSEKQITPHIYPECQNSVLVFVNGIYHPSLSKVTAIPSRVVLSTLNEAMRTYGTLINNQWTRILKEETDPFALLNVAFHEDGFFLYVPPKCIVDVPIQILHILTQDTPQFLSPRIHLFFGAHSQASLVNNVATMNEQGFFLNQTSDLTIEEGAHVKFTQIASHTSAEAWHFDALRAYMKQNSNFTTIAISNGSAVVRNDYRVTLAGDNAEASLNGMWALSENNQAHTHVLIDHQHPNCRSNQLFKGVLNDFSRSSFEGKILVQQAAQKTEAFQLNNNLLLSDRAHADSKPNLEIFADDVKASHGATVGQPDKEQLFYMSTRGFSEATAKNMLVYSFCQEVLDLIPIPSVRKDLSNNIRHYLPKDPP